MRSCIAWTATQPTAWQAGLHQESRARRTSGRGSSHESELRGRYWTWLGLRSCDVNSDSTLTDFRPSDATLSSGWLRRSNQFDERTSLFQLGLAAAWEPGHFAVLAVERVTFTTFLWYTANKELTHMMAMVGRWKSAALAKNSWRVYLARTIALHAPDHSSFVTAYAPRRRAPISGTNWGGDDWIKPRSVTTDDQNAGPPLGFSPCLRAASPPTRHRGD